MKETVIVALTFVAFFAAAAFVVSAKTPWPVKTSYTATVEVDKPEKIARGVELALEDVRRRDFTPVRLSVDRCGGGASYRVRCSGLTQAGILSLED